MELLDVTPPPLDLIPTAVAAQSVPINAIAIPSNVPDWLITADAQNRVTIYDIAATLSPQPSKASLLTNAQRQGHVQSVTRCAVVVGSYVSENVLPHDDAPLKSPWSNMGIGSIAVQADALWCLEGHSNGTLALRTLRVARGMCHAQLSGPHSAPISGIGLLDQDQSTAIAISFDCQQSQWDLHTGKLVRIWEKCHFSQISSICVQKEQSWTWLTSGMDGSVAWWDRRSSEPVQRFTDPPGENKKSGWIYSVQWHRIPTQFMTCRRNGQCDVWDVRNTQQPLISLRHPKLAGSVTRACSLSDDIIVTAAQDNLRIWSLNESSGPENLEKRGTLVTGHHSATVSDMLATDQYLVTASGTRGWDGKVGDHAYVYRIEQRE